jgi:lipopolysaccharide export system protein LptA
MKVRSEVNTTAPVLRFMLLLLYSLVPLQASALSSDAQQPIHVEADSLEVREVEKISIYSGKVSLKQGSLEIQGELLTLYFNDKKEITKMILTGNPATFRQLDDQQQEIRGRAEQMEYRQSKSTFILLNNAQLTHLGDTIESNRIKIDSVTGSVVAGSKNTDDRVRMLIQPEQE